MLDSTIVARPMVSPRRSMGRMTGVAGGWILGIAWLVLGLGLMYAVWLGTRTDAATGERPLLVLAVGVAAGTLLQFLLLFSYGLLLRGMAVLLRRVG